MELLSWQRGIWPLRLQRAPWLSGRPGTPVGQVSAACHHLGSRVSIPGQQPGQLTVWESQLGQGSGGPRPGMCSAGPRGPEAIPQGVIRV